MLSNLPDLVYSEIVKLNGVEFKCKPLVLEEAKAKQKDRAPEQIMNSQIITSTTRPATATSTATPRAM